MHHTGNTKDNSIESINTREQLCTLINSLTEHEMNILIDVIELFRRNETSHWQEILDKQN